MNKLFLEMLQKRIDYYNDKFELFNKEDDIIEITVIESYYSALKYARDLYLNCCEEENEETTND